MDADIQFGEVEEVARETRLRPDQNKHFAVAGHESPVDGDLPIFVDLDVMRDMEAHAASDTSVELGGVLLGGQYEDEDGRPFVVVTDSLRAEHYESTKGSFKFTHDTWSQITRERDEFPDDLQMVGWYHTHPDWGVFLSGMDMFICDNFFNKELDIALVIDPCRGDRGMFQWTGNPSERVRRTGGFYLTASRFRKAELDWYVMQLEGNVSMNTSSGFGGYPGPMPAPVVNISDGRNGWQGTAILGMLCFQFLFLALIGWKQFFDPAEKDAAAEKRRDEVFERLVKAQENRAATDAQQEVWRQVLMNLERMPEERADLLLKKQEELEQFKTERQATLSGYRSLSNQYQGLARDHTALTSDNKKLGKTIAALREDKTSLLNDKKAKSKEIAALKKELGDEDDGKFKVDWMSLGIGVAGTLAAVAAVFTAVRKEDTNASDSAANGKVPPEGSE